MNTFTCTHPDRLESELDLWLREQRAAGRPEKEIVDGLAASIPAVVELFERTALAAEPQAPALL